MVLNIYIDALPFYRTRPRSYNEFITICLEYDCINHQVDSFKKVWKILFIISLRKIQDK